MSESIAAVQAETVAQPQAPRRHPRPSKPAAKPSALSRLVAWLNPPSPDPKKRQFAQAKRYYLDRAKNYDLNRLIQICGTAYTVAYLMILLACPYITPSTTFCVVLEIGFGIAAVAATAAFICTHKIAQPRAEAESFAVYYTGSVDHEGRYTIPKDQLDFSPYARFADEHGRAKLPLREFYKVFTGQKSHNSLGHV